MQLRIQQQHLNFLRTGFSLRVKCLPFEWTKYSVEKSLKSLGGNDMNGLNAHKM